jgi:hypothetical protein
LRRYAAEHSQYLPGGLVVTHARRKGLSDAAFDRLVTLIRRYERESQRCAEVKAYYAACAMLGAAVEGSLLAMCCAYPKEVKRAIQSLPENERPRGRWKRWALHQLLIVAKTAGWLPARRGKRGRLKVGDWAELLQELRNLVHPGKHLRSYPKVRIRRGHLADARTVFEAVNDHLYQKLAADLRDAVER